MEIKTKKTQWVQDNLRVLEPKIGKQATQLWKAYQFSDEDGKAEIEEQIELLAGTMNTEVQDVEPAFICPEQDQSAGEFLLGDILYNGKTKYPFGLRSKELFQHIAIFGRSGAGKTNVGFLFVKSLLNNQIPFTLFDWKRNYRDLLAVKGFENIKVYTVGREIAPFSFNPLIPPENVEPKIWLKKIISVISHTYFLGEGVMYLLQNVLDTVFSKAGIYDGTVQNWPTFRDVLHELKRLPIKGGRESLWLSSTLRAIASLCFGQSDAIFNKCSNQGLSDLFKQNVVFELESLSQQDKCFFTQSMLLWVHMSKMAGTEKREVLSNMIIIEEAHHIISKYARKNAAAGENIVDTVMRELREFGTGICLLDQHGSEISLTALGNTYTTICMNLKSKQDVVTMSGAMLLDKEQERLLGNMEIGKAVMKLQGRISEPFIISVPLMAEVKKGSMTDDILKEKMSLHVQKTEVLKVVLSDIEKAFLNDVTEFPDSGVAARYKRLSISVRQGDKWKKELMRKGMVKEFEKFSNIGRSKNLELTEKGRKTLNTN